MIELDGSRGLNPDAAVFIPRLDLVALRVDATDSGDEVEEAQALTHGGDMLEEQWPDSLQYNVAAGEGMLEENWPESSEYDVASDGEQMGRQRMLRL